MWAYSRAGVGLCVRMKYICIYIYIYIYYIYQDAMRGQLSYVCTGINLFVCAHIDICSCVCAHTYTHTHP